MTDEQKARAWDVLQAFTEHPGEDLREVVALCMSMALAVAGGEDFDGALDRIVVLR
jgi:hypothetical protein